MAIYDATAYVVQMIGECDGVPYIDGTNITVDRIYEAYFVLGLNAEQIMTSFALAPVQVFSALTFVHQYEKEICGLYERRRRYY